MPMSEIVERSRNWGCRYRKLLNVLEALGPEALGSSWKFLEALGNNLS